MLGSYTIELYVVLGEPSSVGWRLRVEVFPYENADFGLLSPFHKAESLAIDGFSRFHDANTEPLSTSEKRSSSTYDPRGTQRQFEIRIYSFHPKRLSV